MTMALVGQAFSLPPAFSRLQPGLDALQCVLTHSSVFSATSVPSDFDVCFSPCLRVSVVNDLFPVPS